jgi:hypothetical protein
MPEYILDVDVVRESFWDLVDRRIHRLFPGYLCLRREAGRENRLDDLDFDYNEFFDKFFEIRTGKKPYLVPFTVEDSEETELWFNENVAGTYAPSSLRTTTPLLKIGEFEKDGRKSRWKLHDNHAELAREHMCNGEHVPVEHLAAFLFRDYGFQVDEPSADTLVQVFCEEWVYDRDSPAFTELYSTGETDIEPSDFIEL